jgi:murein tripeptide amidase MpaA
MRDTLTAMFSQYASMLGAVLMTAQFNAPLPPAPEWRGASENLIVGGDHPWITPAEANGFTSTPSYAETRAWLERLAAASPLVRIETFGRSPQGRELIVVFATANDGELDPDKRTLFVQCGIHPGEIDGKDAGMMLLRDIAFGAKRDLLDSVNLVFVPIFSVDGHEYASQFSSTRPRRAP